ncbi:MAG: sigma-E factor negative regulatory protein [Pseudomonadales bacterium]|nr:sigma-E factor negative regulatory protein [Pseudomonadales bacterium]
MSEAEVSSDDISLPGHGQLNSQLSAMYDGELPAAECELLARRLARDTTLRDQWGRYALIGAALRSDQGVRLDDRIARRVAAVLAGGAQGDDAAYALESSGTHGAGIAAPSRKLAANRRWLRPVAGIGIAASVAAAAILLLRTDAPVTTGESLVAALPVGSGAALGAADRTALNTRTADRLDGAQPAESDASQPDNGEPARYVTPQVPPNSVGALVPSAQLANYVVAHSEVSGPLSRRIVLSGLVASEAVAGTADAEANDAVR